MPSTILALPGSLRSGSYNRMLAAAAARLAPPGTTIEVGSIAGIPLYDGDLQEQGMPEPVTELKERLAAADGLLLVTPEYNWSLPGVMKNAIDWCSRPAAEQPRVFGDLPVALIGAGGRGGTRLSQSAWLPVLRTLGTRPWTGSSLFAARAWELFSDGELTDEPTREQLTKVIERFAAHCAEHLRHRPSA